MTKEERIAKYKELGELANKASALLQELCRDESFSDRPISVTVSVDKMNVFNKSEQRYYSRVQIVESQEGQSGIDYKNAYDTNFEDIDYRVKYTVYSDTAFFVIFPKE